MKLGFEYVYVLSKRKIVFHHCFEYLDNFKDNLEKKINDYDLIFFDDCVYSQYVFIKKYYEIFRRKNCFLVIGFSSSLYRNDEDSPILNITTSDIHNECNKFIFSYLDRYEYDIEELCGFMSISEIKELLSYDRIYLALHGCCHLNLNNNESDICKCINFTNDIRDGITLLKNNKLNTNIFVFPYDFSIPLFDVSLYHNNFIFIFGGKKTQRIPFESL